MELRLKTYYLTLQLVHTNNVIADLMLLLSSPFFEKRNCRCKRSPEVVNEF